MRIEFSGVRRAVALPLFPLFGGLCQKPQLGESCTLGHDEFVLVENHRGASNRLGFALQLLSNGFPKTPLTPHLYQVTLYCKVYKRVLAWNYVKQSADNRVSRL